MARFDPGFGRLVLATHNPGKVREIADLVAPLGLDVVSAGDLGLDEPEETGQTFAANAALKARAAAEASGLPALADDSGLAVDALAGAPGIYSARWAGPGKDFGLAMAEVERQLQENGASAPEARRAQFVCALCLAAPGKPERIFEGEVHGTLVWPPRGRHGFGYDPMFLPDGEVETFGEMAPMHKHAMSHRARAFKLLLAGISGAE